VGQDVHAKQLMRAAIHIGAYFAAGAHDESAQRPVPAAELKLTTAGGLQLRERAQHERRVSMGIRHARRLGGPRYAASTAACASRSRRRPSRYSSSNPMRLSEAV